MTDPATDPATTPVTDAVTEGGLASLSVEELTIADAPTMSRVGIYRALADRARADGLRFAVPAPDSPLAGDHPTRLLNLAFWRPGDIAEILPEPVLSADQLAHNVWHHVAHRALGADAQSVAGLLLAEAVASAFDVYLVGRLLGHVPDAPFLESQVPAMSEAAFDAGLDEEGFTALLETMSAEPERSFERLRQLLYDLSSDLAACPDADAAAAALRRHAAHPFAALTHHYELPTWVLFARAYADPQASGEAARAADAALRAADDPIAWLEDHWVTGS